MSEYDEQPDLAPGEDGADLGAADESAAAHDASVGSELRDGDDASGDGWEAPSTGVPAVDDVLVAVHALDDRPVEEHVAVFEQAHDRLRRALDPGHG